MGHLEKCDVLRYVDIDLHDHSFVFTFRWEKTLYFSIKCQNDSLHMKENTKQASTPSHT